MFVSRKLSAHFHRTYGLIMNRDVIFALVMAFMTGFTLSYLLTDTKGSWFNPDCRASIISSVLNSRGHNPKEKLDKMENNATADTAGKEIRILCWVMTGPKTHKTKAEHVKATWGKRCNILLFMSSEKDSSLPTIALPVKEGRKQLWAKTRESFKYVYRNYIDKADWFFKADDDTYAILENLRHMLSSHKPSEPIYFGCKFKYIVKQGYMSGGSGYVLSREAVKRFVEIGLKNETNCPPGPGDEDVEIGNCLEGIKVQAADSRDSIKRGTFFPLSLSDQLWPHVTDKNSWFYRYTSYQYKKGMDCCSDYPISFHYVKPSEMYVFEYLIYRARAHGVSDGVKRLPTK